MAKMMKLTFIFVSLVSLLTLTTVDKAYALDPKVKAVGTMAIYGTTGGLLLGVASYAFDSPGRSWAIGASVGLYAGLLFGAYVVGSHYYKGYKQSNPDREEGYYPDTESSPYEDGGGNGEDGGAYERWVPAYKRSLELRSLTIGETPNLNPKLNNGLDRRKKQRPNIYLNLYNYQF